MEKDNSKEQQKSEIALREEAILKFWQENKIFEKSLAKPSPKGEYVFYDGPPFATGTPHYGHILGSAAKDTVPRYKTMKGYYVARRWGWDCHGLPIENIAEKDLKISGKKQIEEIGIKTFNEHARSKVLEFIHEWKRTVDRMARWVDFDGSYKTMDNTFMESVWWALAEIHKKGLLYEGTRVLPYCPRCETPIANSEIAMDNSYRDIKDLSVTVKFELVGESPSTSSGHAKTYVLAWTTTPWTLPGNVALAIGLEMDYVKIKLIKEVAPVEAPIEARETYDLETIEADKQASLATIPKEEYFILAKERLEAVIKGKYEIVETFKGATLVGKKYRPAFPYYQTGPLENRENGWQIYPASFVTTEDGTGVVHIAPAFGEDDMSLAKQVKLPIIWHVDFTGRFKPEVTDFVGLQVKPKDHHQDTDIEVLKYLAAKDLLFSKENIVHSYPHCFRCETPLYYYAIPAWFIDVQKVKSRFIALNEEKINWIPAHLKLGRFKNIMESAPDWNISRNRYWATPLPIWKCEKCLSIKVVGSIEELKKNTGADRNRYFLMRHGESENNLTDTIDCKIGGNYHLTERGKGQVRASAEQLKEAKIDLIVSSDFVRAKETAELTAEVIGYSPEKIVYDERLREYDAGNANGGKWADFDGGFASKEEKYRVGHAGGESCLNVKKRMGNVLVDLNEKYAGKNILIVSHSLPLLFMVVANDYLTEEQILKVHKWGSSFANGEARELIFNSLPHNDNFDLDLHRPYIDSIEFACTCGETQKRITEVTDCWLESGSMPFAANHYPFENTDWLEKSFPSQFVAEYIAQTRTWFYYMLAVSTMLFDNVPFENVVTTGVVLAEDGQKMSKSKGNFPDPWLIFDKYGADALRYYLLASPLMKAEDLFFSEKSVAEISRKIIARLLNVGSFFEMYTKDVAVKAEASGPKNVLDRWILARLAQLTSEIDRAMEGYELDKALRPVDEFIDDLSNWYLRRSRDRFKSDDATDQADARRVTKYVLRETAKLVAPFMPYVAEEVWLKLKEEGDVESVHLADWPEGAEFDVNVIEGMKTAREIVEMGLALRDQKSIRVRQVLKELLISESAYDLGDEFLTPILEEVNVKEVKKANLQGLRDDEYVFYNNTGVVKINNSVIQTRPAIVDGRRLVALRYVITDDLRWEGEMRELVRLIQDLRKQKGLNPEDKIALKITANDYGQKLVARFEADIKKLTGSEKIEVVSGGQGSVAVGEGKFTLEIA